MLGADQALKDGDRQAKMYYRQGRHQNTNLLIYMENLYQIFRTKQIFKLHSLSSPPRVKPHDKPSLVGRVKKKTKKNLDNVKVNYVSLTRPWDAQTVG